MPEAKLGQIPDMLAFFDPERSPLYKCFRERVAVKTSAVSMRVQPIVEDSETLAEVHAQAVSGQTSPKNKFALNQGSPLQEPSLQMYTEEQVSVFLQVSLSQLRKWRMTKNRGKDEGPPFRKFGRLVRYPGRALQEYVNGNRKEPPD